MVFTVDKIIELAKGEIEERRYSNVTKLIEQVAPAQNTKEFRNEVIFKMIESNRYESQPQQDGIVIYKSKNFGVIKTQKITLIITVAVSIITAVFQGLDVWIAKESKDVLELELRTKQGLPPLSITIDSVIVR